MDRNIVVLECRGALEDRSWMCHAKGEGDRLAMWLTNNHIAAKAYTTEAWNRMQASEDKT
jgi:hypothetical protein